MMLFIRLTVIKKNVASFGNVWRFYNFYKSLYLYILFNEKIKLSLQCRVHAAYLKRISGILNLL